MAYENLDSKTSSSARPESLNLLVVGGPYGSGPAHVSSEASGAGQSEREKTLVGQELIERCRFINWIHDEIGV